MGLNPFGKREDESALEADQDQRIAKRDEPLYETRNADRQERTLTENREVSDVVRGSERRAMLRDTNTLLPAPPEVKGYHSFWATTTNTKDTVEQRQRLGYTFITREEAPNFEFSSLKGGESSSDRIMVNEMVAMKIPLEYWREDMMDLHHTLPKEQMGRLKDGLNIFKDDGSGRNIAYTGSDFKNGQTDGYDKLGKMLPPTLKGVA